jgi:hypothetical protein
MRNDKVEKRRRGEAVLAHVRARHEIADGEEQLRAHHDHDRRLQPSSRAHSGLRLPIGLLGLDEPGRRLDRLERRAVKQHRQHLAGGDDLHVSQVGCDFEHRRIPLGRGQIAVGFGQARAPLGGGIFSRNGATRLAVSFDTRVMRGSSLPGWRKSQAWNLSSMP